MSMNDGKKPESNHVSRRVFLGTVGVVIAGGVACGNDGEGTTSESTGGSDPSTGGNSSGGAGAPGSGGVGADTGGVAPTGGASGGTGAVPTGTGGVTPGTGGTAGTGGGPVGATAGTGGSTPVGGTAGTGGGPVGATAGTGGSTPVGGTAGTGGSTPVGGGGTTPTGGTPATGGDAPTGGAAGEGGSGGAGGQTALVSLVRDTDVAAATERAIALAGGLPSLAGLSVLLRPNVISNDPPPTTTNPEVIRGVIRAAKAAGAASIQVADDGWATNDTVASMQTLGIAAVCSEEGATPLELKNGATRLITHANATAWPNGMNFYTAVLDADFVINIPVCKSHAMANYTMALKAWYGHVPSGERNHQSLANQLAELHLAKQEGFVVLDATKAMVTGGPQTGETASPGIVVASRDAIAADVTGLCIHKHFGTGSGAVANLGVWEQQQIQRAMALAFPGWLSAPTDFDYASEGVDEHAEIMARRNA